MKIPEMRYSDYDRFAWFYNRYWGSSSYIDKVIAILDDLLLSHLPVNGRILDLCCGTGQVAHALTTRGFQVMSHRDVRNLRIFQAMCKSTYDRLMLSQAPCLPYATKTTLRCPGARPSRGRTWYRVPRHLHSRC